MRKYAESASLVDVEKAIRDAEKAHEKSVEYFSAGNVNYGHAAARNARNHFERARALCEIVRGNLRAFALEVGKFNAVQ